MSYSGVSMDNTLEAIATGIMASITSFLRVLAIKKIRVMIATASVNGCDEAGVID